MTNLWPQICNKKRDGKMVRGHLSLLYEITQSVFYTYKGWEWVDKWTHWNWERERTTNCNTYIANNLRPRHRAWSAGHSWSLVPYLLHQSSLYVHGHWVGEMQSHRSLDCYLDSSEHPTNRQSDPHKRHHSRFQWACGYPSQWRSGDSSGCSLRGVAVA